MNKVDDNSSLPLLLSITGAVLAVAVGGWFYLEQADSVADATLSSPPSAATASSLIDSGTEILESVPTIDEGEGVSATVSEAEPLTETVAADNDLNSAKVDAELRKARLAASADILIFPPEQSALYYYGLVLDIDPQHAVAIAELDATLAKAAQTIRRHLDAEEFNDAYDIAFVVAKRRPEHPLVVETQQTLDTYAKQLIDEAIQHAQDGQDDQATQFLATAQGLPGRNSDYFAEVRDSVAEIRNVRQAAAREKAQRALLANDEARAAWVKSVRKSIADGNLISPAGASAKDLLAEDNKWTAERGQLTGEFLSALVDTTKSDINDNQLASAEGLLRVAEELIGGSDELADIRATLEHALIEAKSNRVAAMSELVQLKSVPPRYPRRAQQANVTGWVEVVFTVMPSGDTAGIEVLRSEPGSVFERAATDAIEQWEFQPVEYRGQLISQRAGTRLVFRFE